MIASFVGGWGHVEPLLPVAALATRRGHDVSFAGQRAIAGKLTELGHRVDIVGPDTLRSEPSPLEAVDRSAERRVMRDHFVARFGDARATSLAQLFERERVDLVICDEVDVGAVIAAESLGVPCVTANVIAAGRLMACEVVGTAWRELRRAHGLDDDPACELMAGTLALAPVPRAFRDPAVPVPAAMSFVRPSILADVETDVAPSPAYDRPTVYVTLGTVFNLESGDLVDRLLRAANRLARSDSVDVIVTIGPHVDPADLQPCHDRVQVARFVAQREVLGRSDAVVCHGGSGTVIAALSLGVPVVVLPLGADQPDNADRCRDLGAGIVLDPLTASPGEIADATRAALHARELRSAARSLAEEAASQPPIEHQPDLRRLVGP